MSDMESDLPMSRTDSESITAFRGYVFEFVGYLLTCAEMSLSSRGSPRYSALRFIEAARRLIDLPKSATHFGEDLFLSDIRKRLDCLKIEQDEVKQLHDQLKDLLLEFADEAAKRAKSVPANADLFRRESH
jgi:hypothetical protein